MGGERYPRLYLCARIRAHEHTGPFDATQEVFFSASISYSLIPACFGPEPNICIYLYSPHLPLRMALMVEEIRLTQCLELEQ